MQPYSLHIPFRAHKNAYERERIANRRLASKRSRYLNRIGQRYLAIAVFLALCCIPMLIFGPTMVPNFIAVMYAMYFVTGGLLLISIPFLMLAYLG